MGSKNSTKVPTKGTKKASNLSKVTPGPRQVRAARAAVDMSAQHLAELAGVTKNTVLRYERGVGRPMVDTLQAMRTVLEEAGIEFIDRGVRWREDD